MSYAPAYEVPENASPFVPLPLLSRCHECRIPLEPLGLLSVVRDGVATRGLCAQCAEVMR